MSVEMSVEQITQKVIDILRQYVKDTARLEQVTPETHIIKDQKVNSARIVDVVIKCEDAFGISFDDDETDRITTIEGVVSLIQYKVTEKLAA